MDKEPQSIQTLSDAPAFEGIKPEASTGVDWEKVCRESEEHATHSACEGEWRRFFGSSVIDTDWDHPDLQRNREAIETVRNWQYGPVGILLTGITGAGKTRSLAALVYRLHVEERFRCSLWNSQELMSEIALQHGYGRTDAREFIDTLSKRDVLVIDDLGQEATLASREEVARQWFFRLLDIRSANGRPCLITTNHTASSLAQSVRAVSSDPLIRRLLAVADPVKFV